MRLLGLDALRLGLALAAFTAVLLVLYLLRRPTRRVIVPALALWDALVPERRRASALFRRLRALWSLLLALAIGSLVLLALGDPAPTRGRAGRDVLLVIDRSASMAARDVTPNRLARAKARAQQWVDRLGPDDRAAVATLDDGATPRTALTSDRSQLLAAIAEIDQGAGVGDLGRASRLALDLFAHSAHPELVLLSDGQLLQLEAAERELAARPGLTARYERIGTSARNVAITSFSARRYPLDKTHHESLVAVSNFGAEPEPLRLQIRAAGRLLFEQSFTLAPHASETRAITDLPSGQAALDARIVLGRGPDALPADDQARVSLPPRARTRVLSVSPGNRYLEAALLLDEYLDVVEVDPAHYRSADGFDVVIFDAVLPAEPPQRPALYLGAPAAGAFPLARSGVIERPFFDRVDKDHALLRGLALTDVNVARAARMTLAPGDVALAATQQRAPLLSAGRRDGRPFLALSFDLRESDLPLRPAWPLFLLRALDQLAEEPAAALASAETAASAGPIAPRAALFSRALAPAATGGSRLPRRLWPLLALAALVLLGLEWLTFHRRWTV